MTFPADGVILPHVHLFPPTAWTVTSSLACNGDSKIFQHVIQRIILEHHLSNLRTLGTAHVQRVLIFFLTINSLDVTPRRFLMSEFLIQCLDLYKNIFLTALYLNNYSKYFFVPALWPRIILSSGIGRRGKI